MTPRHTCTRYPDLPVLDLPEGPIGFTPGTRAPLTHGHDDNDSPTGRTACDGRLSEVA